MSNPDSSNASTPAGFSPASEKKSDCVGETENRGPVNRQAGLKRKHATPSAGTDASKPTTSKRNIPRKRRRTQNKPPKQLANRNFSEKGVPYGSYKQYNRRRKIGPDDPRLKLLSKDWTTDGGRVLDIGCNDGALTSLIAQRYAQARVLGVDIDEELVKRAQQRIADKIRTLEKGGVKPEQTNKEPTAEGESETLETRAFPYNLSFDVENVCDATVDESALGAGQYELVTAFSVTKWLHMHSGDDGLKRVFKRVYAALKPGGVFVMEPQPTKSYKAARRKGAVAADLTVDKFKFKPDKFGEWLTTEGGFERMETLRDRLPKNTPFGTRPVYAFFKAQQ